MPYRCIPEPSSDIDCCACAIGMKRSADPEFSLLAVCALQQALKVACSSKLPSESRAWISAYTAAVLSQLIRTQIDPQSLCHLVLDLFCQAADAKAATPVAVTDADAAQHAQQLDNTQISNPAEHAVVLSLPNEAQTLASLLSCAQGVLHQWQSLGRTTNPRQPQPHQQSPGSDPSNLSGDSKTKKRRKADGADVDSVKKRKKQKQEVSSVAFLPSGSESTLQVLHSALSCCRVSLWAGMVCTSLLQNAVPSALSRSAKHQVTFAEFVSCYACFALASGGGGHMQTCCCHV